MLGDARTLRQSVDERRSFLIKDPDAHDDSDSDSDSDEASGSGHDQQRGHVMRNSLARGSGLDLQDSLPLAESGGRRKSGGLSAKAGIILVNSLMPCCHK